MLSLVTQTISLRASLIIFSEVWKAQPIEIKSRSGKAEPFRTVRRQAAGRFCYEVRTKCFTGDHRNSDRRFFAGARAKLANRSAERLRPFRPGLYQSERGDAQPRFHGIACQL